MRKVIVSEWMTLDGVVQAPISPGEDTDGGFTHGGWHVPHVMDQQFQRCMEESIAGADGFLFGRRTYENFAAYWPNAPQEEQGIARPLNSRPKFVASTSLVQPTWENSTVLRGDVAKAVAALKEEGGAYLLVIGSTKLVHTLMTYGLADELRLTIDPVVVGGGKRLFDDDGMRRRLRLVESHATATGAIMATYASGAEK